MSAAGAQFPAAYVQPLSAFATPRQAAEALRAVLTFQGVSTALECQQRVDAAHAGEIVHVVAGAGAQRVVASSFFTPVRQPGVWRVSGLPIATIIDALRSADLVGIHAEGLLVAIQRDLFDLDRGQFRLLTATLDAASELLAAMSSPHVERIWLLTLAYITRVAASDALLEGAFQ